MLYYGPLQTLWLLGLFLPFLGVTIRRLHDIGKSGWIILIQIIPTIMVLIAVFPLRTLTELSNDSAKIQDWVVNHISQMVFLAISILLALIGSIWLLALLVRDGTRDKNKYGHNPKVSIFKNIR